MTNGIREVVQRMTGDVIPSCPWRPLSKPFVGRVIELINAKEDGNMAFVAPSPSHRLVQGVQHYMAVDNQVHGLLLDNERAIRERKAAAVNRG